MSMSITRIAGVGAVVALLFGAPNLAAEQAKSQAAPQNWAPPAEISGKPAAPAAPGAAPSSPAAAGTPTPAPTTATNKADKEKECVAQAQAKGLRKGARWSFIDKCLKQ
jgi:hypothetical protein